MNDRSAWLRASLIAFAAFAAATETPASAADENTGLADALALDPVQWEVGDLEIKLGGFAYGAAYAASQSGSYDRSGVTAQSRANLIVQRTLDNGMVLGARGDVLVYHDNLSGDNYGNDAIERLYLFAQTGFGRVELGEDDGVSYGMGLTGPTVDDHLTLENPDSSLFRILPPELIFSAFLRQVTPLNSSSNYAKFNYLSPRLFGVQIGVSFTPSTVKAPLPGLGNPGNGPDRQDDIVEASAGYTGYVSGLAVGASLAYDRGSLKNGTPGFADLYDWSLGAQIAYDISNLKLSLGGGYRLSNADAFDITQVYRGGETHRAHVGALAEMGSWHLGAEYSNTDTNGPVHYDMNAYELAAGYKLNDNLYATAGWEWYDYARNTGTFYNGGRTIEMNAGFLTIGYDL